MPSYVERVPQPVFGGTNDIPIPAGIDGDGKADLVLWRPDGTLRVWESGTGEKWTTALGLPAWLPAMADYDGDGFSDPAWFIPATGRWRILESSRGYLEPPQAPIRRAG
jgi:hypothetical protein